VIDLGKPAKPGFVFSSLRASSVFGKSAALILGYRARIHVRDWIRCIFDLREERPALSVNDVHRKEVQIWQLRPSPSFST
jgi:hypothetical protein